MRAWQRGRRIWNRRGLRSVATLAVVAAATLYLLGGIAMADGDTPPCEQAPREATPGRADDAMPPLLRPTDVTAPSLAPAIRRDKMDGALGAVAEAAVMSGDEAAISAAQARNLAVSGGMVRVLVETDNPDLSPAKAAIVAAGGAVEGEYADTIQALMPPSGLDALAANPDVRYVRTPARGMPGRSP